MVDLVGGGLLSTGPTPSSLRVFEYFESVPLYSKSVPIWRPFLVVPEIAGSVFFQGVR